MKVCWAQVHWSPSHLHTPPLFGRAHWNTLPHSSTLFSTPFQVYCIIPVLYMCMCAYTCMYARTCTYVYDFVHVYIHLRTCTCTCRFVCIYMYVHVQFCTHVDVHVYACRCWLIYVYIGEYRYTCKRTCCFSVLQRESLPSSVHTGCPSTSGARFHPLLSLVLPHTRHC